MSVLAPSCDVKPSAIAVCEETLVNWLREYSRLPFGQGRKRVMDVVIAAALLLVLAPALAVIVAIVWVRGGSPLYGHERIGRGGQLFRCWKVRTMHRDAADQLGHLLRDNPAAALEWSRNRKLRCDPRVTRFGRWLRLTSLDELPQLWNVLVGDMSLVGPRPVTPEELCKYGPSARHYLAVRPGLTGLWQLAGRNNLPYRRRVGLDRFYVMHASLGLDLLLLVSTPAAVFCRTGF